MLTANETTLIEQASLVSHDVAGDEVVQCLIDGLVEELGGVNVTTLSPQCRKRMDNVIAAAREW